MTKSTITRERLEKIKSWRETYSAGSNVMLPAEEAEELARMALAAMDSEPVATLDVQSRRPDGNKFALVFSSAAHKLPDDVYFLYRHAQPAPVVPEEWTIADAVKFCKETGRQDAGAAMDAWNACRAAMLAAAPHDTPALNSLQSVDSVTGGWIPVSERMPDVGDIVLTAMGGSVNVAEMERSGANYRYFTSVISGRELPATHWMPLPAAPQEVKGES